MSARRPVLALTALALVVRVATLDVQSFWSDEAATADVLHHSLGGMLDAVWDGESTPPLFYLVTWLWSQVAGTGEIALRLPAALLGTTMVPVVAALAARLARARTVPSGHDGAVDRAAVAGALLVAVGPLTVWYSQEARAYALLMLLAAGSTLGLLRALEAPTRRRLAAWAVLAIAAFWTHHFAVFLVAGQAAWALWVLRSRAIAAVGAVAVGALALAPILLHQRAAGRASFIADVPLHTRLAQLPKQVLVGYDGPAEVPLALIGAAAVLAALAGLGLALTRARAQVSAAPNSETATGAGASPPAAGAPPADVVVLSVVAAGLLLPALAAVVGQDFLLTRNLLGALPLVLALVAAGAAALGGRSGIAGSAGAAAIAALAAVGAISGVAVARDPAYQRDDFRAAIEATVRGPQHPRLVITEAAGRVPAALYLGRDATIAAPDRPRPVREIDIVLIAASQPGRKRSTPQLPPDPPLPAGFTFAGAAHGDTWTVRRFVAPATIAVDPGAVGVLEPGGNPVVFFRTR